MTIHHLASKSNDPPTLDRTAALAAELRDVRARLALTILRARRAALKAGR